MILEGIRNDVAQSAISLIKKCRKNNIAEREKIPSSKYKNGRGRSFKKPSIVVFLYKK